MLAFQELSPEEQSNAATKLAIQLSPSAQTAIYELQKRLKRLRECPDLSSKTSLTIEA